MKTIGTLADCWAWCFWDSVFGFFTFADCICCKTECRFTSFSVFDSFPCSVVQSEAVSLGYLKRVEVFQIFSNISL